MERCLRHARGAFENTLKELSMTDRKQEYRGKLKKCLNSTLTPGVMALDKYEYLKKYEDRNMKPDRVIQKEIIAVREAYNAEEDGEILGTQGISDRQNTCHIKRANEGVF